MPTFARASVLALAQDLRFAVRGLLRAPGFAVVTVVTLALGIGATTGVFSLVNGLLLRELPYDEPHRLVTVWLDLTQRQGPDREWFSPADFEAYRAEPDLFEEIGAWGGFSPTLSGDGEPQVLVGAAVTEGMFARVLRTNPVLGRDFLPSEDTPGGPGAVLLSYGLWQQRFGGDPSVLGRAISLNEQPIVVVGVMPEGFRPPFAPGAQLWTTLRLDPGACGFGCYTIRTVARLAPSLSPSLARERASALAVRLEEAHPESNGRVGVTIAGLREDVARPVASRLWVLFGAVGIVLLIACTNVANLLLVRGGSREAEFAVRAALGAGRGVIFRQLLTESAVLVGAGGALGVAMAWWGTGAVLAVVPQLSLPGMAPPDVDGRVLLFAAGVVIVTGLLFGLVPAWRAHRADLYASVRAASSGGRLGRRLRDGLAVTQIAMALVLLVGAGLLLRSFRQLNNADLGFRPEGVLAVNLALPGTRYADGPERTSYYQALLDRLGALPGVESAGATSSLPLAGADGDADFRIEGRPPSEPSNPSVAWIRRLAGDYTETVGLDLLQGRSFAASDDAEAPRVVIVNETLARRYFDYPAQDPVGTRVAFGSGTDPVWRTIVGVVGDTRHFAIRDGTRPAIYFPYRQVPSLAMSIVIRAEGDPVALAGPVRATVSEIDPALAASSVRPLAELVDAALAGDRFVTGLLGAFAVAALVLASVGLYGVISYSVGQRMREMGIRMALGADAADVRRTVVKSGLALAAAGVGAGLAGALALTGFVEALLYRVPKNDPGTFVVTAGVLTGVALLASWVPAVRAGRADPVAIMRQE